VVFACPPDQTAVYGMCLPREDAVSGLTLGATLHLNPSSSNLHPTTDYRMATVVLNTIQDMLRKQLPFAEQGCDIVFMKAFLNVSAVGYISDVYVEVKVTNTQRCLVKTIVSLFYDIRKSDFVLRTGIATTKKAYLDFNVSFTSNVQSFKYRKTSVSKPIVYSIHLSPTFYCSRVILNSSTYLELCNQGVLLRNSQHNPSQQQMTGNVEVCLSDYLRYSLLSATGKLHKNSMGDQMVASVLSFVCTVVSIVCTGFVLITYAMFPELRFIPGKLFMMLCANLLCAQVSFALSSATSDSPFLCQVVGAAIHFFWLSVILSMTSCLWLMVNNFLQPLEADNRATMQSRSNARLCRFAAPVYMFPLCFVVLNSAVASTVYEDPYYGYSGSFCFISVRNLKIVTFFLPLCVALIVNFAMLALIMVSITNVAHRDGKVFTKHRLLIFVKLSTITGIFWLFGFLYKATEISVFQYLFVFLNGGHGFFLLWSFILNKRVFKLYQSCYSKWKGKSKSISCSNTNNYERFESSV